MSIRLNQSLFPQKMHSENPFKLTPFLTVYSVAHLIVDAACAFLLLGVLELSNVILALLVYNGFAFVLQAPFGFLIDKGFQAKRAAILGLIFVALSFLFRNHALAALIVGGIGNALYHVGGGSLVLSLKEKKATFSGIYVAPGAIGLAVGTFLSHSQLEVYLLIFPLILLLLSILVFFVKTPEFNRPEERMGDHSYLSVLLIVLIMIPISVRSLLGLYVDFPWKENQYLLISLMAAIALGKVFGGVLADRYGLLKVGVGGLLISAPCLAFGSTLPVPGLIGAFVFSFTMPVTLIAILNIIPKYRGLSFGLSTVALFIGSLPVIIDQVAWLKNNWVVFTLVLLASIVLLLALMLENKPKIV